MYRGPLGPNAHNTKSDCNLFLKKCIFLNMCKNFEMRKTIFYSKLKHFPGCNKILGRRNIIFC